MSDKRPKPVDSSDRDIRQAPRRRGAGTDEGGGRVRVEVVVVVVAVMGGGHC